MTELVLLGLLGGIGAVIAGIGLRRAKEPLPGPSARAGQEAPARSGQEAPARSGQEAPARSGRNGSRSHAANALRLDLVPAVAGLGSQIVDRTQARQGLAERRSQALALTGRTSQAFDLTVGVATLAAGLGPALVASLLPGVGLHPPLLAVIGLCLAGGATGAIAPPLALKSAARVARERVLRSLSAWLDLVALAQAGGMGLEGALDAASRLSPDPVFGRIRRALDGARHKGVAPWEALARLGREIGVVELEELSASIALAGTEGARIRATLAAKAASLRRKQLSVAKARANAVTERLFIPSVVLMLGFMVFLLYPAGVAFSHGL